ncbi:MAG: glutathionylspermidine synthase family protein [Peptoniphilaceae bacterium]|nr:glutathionylspermidine synthase family protein [Peptoniphilaceae bacterium]MDY6019327.1 glutathionylspermidine synthase family protein [Anaerococcus sp.]
MFNDKYANQYYKLIQKNTENYYKDYQKSLKKRIPFGATYKKEEVPTLYQGFFYDEETEKEYKKIIKTFMSIAKKVTKKYVEDEDYRKIFNFDPLTEKLILKDPGYSIDIPIARIDIMYDNKDSFKFCEINTDGSSAMLEDLALAKIYMESKIYEDFSKSYKLEKNNSLEGVVDSILELYNKEVDTKKPNVAIVDIIEFDNIEFEEIQKLFKEKGIEAKIVDVRDLKRKNGSLYADDMKIDLVYRRLVTSDLIDHQQECQDFIDSYLNGEFTSIGSLRTSIFYTKDIFRILRLDQTKKILSQEENDFITKHIPFTETFAYNNKDQIIKNKDKYILKPKQGYASHGVFIGKDLTEEAFKEKLEEIKDLDYIYQEYYTVEPMKFIKFKDEKEVDLEDFSTVTGLFVYNNKLSSPYMRIGQESMISSLAAYYVVPAFKISKKI